MCAEVSMLLHPKLLEIRVHILGMRTRIFCLTPAMVDVYVRTYVPSPDHTTLRMRACIHIHVELHVRMRACVHIHV